MTQVLESVAAALSQGKQKIGIVCDKESERKPLLQRLEQEFGPVPEVGRRTPAQDPGIWGLVPDCQVRFIGWGQQLAGLGFDAIIVLNKRVPEMIYSPKSIQRWTDEVLRCRLLPGGSLEEVDG